MPSDRPRAFSAGRTRCHVVAPDFGLSCGGLGAKGPRRRFVYLPVFIDMDGLLVSLGPLLALYRLLPAFCDEIDHFRLLRRTGRRLTNLVEGIAIQLLYAGQPLEHEIGSRGF